MRSLFSFIKKDNKQKRLIAESLIRMTYWHFAIKVLKFDQIINKLQLNQAETSLEENETHEEEIKEIRHSLNRAAFHLPLQPKCLAQALAGWQMFHQRNITATIYFGTKKSTNPSENYEMHAWLRSGSLYITGGDGNGFTFLTNYS